MSDHLLLLVGLASVCAAIALALATVVLGSEDRQRVRRSLAAITASRFTSARVLEERERDFAERVLVPGGARLAALARALSPKGVATRIQGRLDLAGNPRGWTVDRILAFKGLGVIVGPVLGLLIHVSPALRVLLALGFGAIGFFAIDVYIYNSGLHRQEEMQRTLSDAMDLLTICVEAGLGFDAALAQVATNVPGPIGGEFQRVLQEMQIGKTRTDAFRSLADRTSVPELRAFVSSLVQADTFGIPIANVLREQSRENRLKRRQRAEERAQKVPVKIMVPLVLFIFPALFIVIIGPGVLHIIANFSGHGL